jgi:DNA polymerase elongation subunit (family B)
MNKALKTKNVDYVLAADTDSIYVTMEKMLEYLNNDDPHFVVGALDAFCEQKIQPYLDKCYQELADLMNAYQQKMQMKRETIADKGIWKAKKMYILNAWNVEGVQYKEPKLKIQGIEAVRSSTPHVCREKLKDAFSIIMNKDEDNLQKFIADFRDQFMTLSFEDVAFPRGVKGMNKYTDKASVYKKSTPIQVKSALLFNKIVEEKKLSFIQPISDGDKIKYVYLKMPNPIKDSVIANGDLLPREMEIDKYIDRDIQFEKSFLEPLKSVTSIIGWEVEKRSTLEGFF